MTHWPAFDVERDSPTFATLHLASQMLGKVRVANAAWTNHGWHVTLHPSASGLAIEPTACPDGRSFTLALDLCAHAIVLTISDGTGDALPFVDGQSIAELHAALIAMLDRNRLPSRFDGRPNEIADAPRFADDRASRRYDPASAAALRDALPVVPDAAAFDGVLGEFTLPYAAVRASSDPESTLMGFLQSTYEAAADLANWDRLALEREPVAP